MTTEGKKSRPVVTVSPAVRGIVDKIVDRRRETGRPRGTITGVVLDMIRYWEANHDTDEKETKSEVRSEHLAVWYQLVDTIATCSDAEIVGETFNFLLAQRKKVFTLTGNPPGQRKKSG